MPGLGEQGRVPWKATAGSTRYPQPQGTASPRFLCRLPGQAFHPDEFLPGVWDRHAQGTLGQQQQQQRDSYRALSVLVLPWLSGSPQLRVLLSQPHQTHTFA